MVVVCHWLLLPLPFPPEPPAGVCEVSALHVLVLFAKAALVGTSTAPLTVAPTTRAAIPRLARLISGSPLKMTRCGSELHDAAEAHWIGE